MFNASESTTGDAPLYKVVTVHPFGETTSDPLEGRIALKVAKTWQRNGDQVRVRATGGDQSWKVAEFEGRLLWLSSRGGRTLR